MRYQKLTLCNARSCPPNALWVERWLTALSGANRGPSEWLATRIRGISGDNSAARPAFSSRATPATSSAAIRHCSKWKQWPPFYHCYQPRRRGSFIESLGMLLSEHWRNLHSLHNRRRKHSSLHLICFIYLGWVPNNLCRHDHGSFSSCPRRRWTAKSVVASVYDPLSEPSCCRSQTLSTDLNLH